MFRGVAGRFRETAWLRRQFTLDADLTQDLRYGARLIRRTPGFSLLAACGTLSAIAGVACLIPALKATRVSPLVALRTE
jgi:hypothetical protein